MKRWIETNISAESVDGVTRRELFRQAAETRLSETLDIGRFHAPNPDCGSPHCVNRLFRTAHQKKRCPSILGAAFNGGLKSFSTEKLHQFLRRLPARRAGESLAEGHGSFREAAVA